MKRTLFFFGSLVIVTSACAWIVGIDDHVLATNDVIDASMDAPDSGVTITIIAEAGRPGAITADLTGAYWIDEADNSLWHWDVDSGVRSLLAKTQTTPARLGRDAVGSVPCVYYTDKNDAGAGALMRVCLVDGGTPPVAFDTDDAGRAFGTLAVNYSLHAAFTEVFDSQTVYLRRTNLADGGACVIHTSGSPTDYTAIIANNEHAYFSDVDASGIYRVPQLCGSDGGAELFVSGQSQKTVLAMGQGSINVYWLTNAGDVRYRPKEGGSPTNAFALMSGLNDPSDLAVDFPELYVAEELGGNVTHLKLVVDGGKQVLGQQGGPHSIAFTPAEARVLYWTNRSSGQIVRATFP